MTQEQTAFILADQALNDVIQQMSADQWAQEVPDWFQVGAAQDDKTLRAIVNYHAYDELWVPATLAGKPVGDPSMPSRESDHLGDDPKSTFAKLTAAGVTAVSELAADALDRPVHLSYGDWPARDYLLHITSFRGFRTYDLSKTLGLDTKMNDELVQALWDVLSPHFDEWRQWGVYQPALPVPEDASLQDKLLLLSGRYV